MSKDKRNTALVLGADEMARQAEEVAAAGEVAVLEKVFEPDHLHARKEPAIHAALLRDVTGLTCETGLTQEARLHSDSVLLGLLKTRERDRVASRWVRGDTVNILTNRMYMKSHDKDGNPIYEKYTTSRIASISGIAASTLNTDRLLCQTFPASMRLVQPVTPDHFVTIRELLGADAEVLPAVAAVAINRLKDFLEGRISKVKNVLPNGTIERETCPVPTVREWRKFVESLKAAQNEPPEVLSAVEGVALGMLSGAIPKDDTAEEGLEPVEDFLRNVGKTDVPDTEEKAVIRTKVASHFRAASSSRGSGSNGTGTGSADGGKDIRITDPESVNYLMESAHGIVGAREVAESVIRAFCAYRKDEMDGESFADVCKTIRFEPAAV